MARAPVSTRLVTGHAVYTGLLGGSFNPAHPGHRRISKFALDALALDEVWWLVSPGNPLKPAAGMAPLAARLASASRMARGTRIRATAVERDLHTRYTVDTLRALIRRYPNRRFLWLMGADNLAQFHRWRAWRMIARMVPIAVIARPGHDSRAVFSPAMRWLGPYRTSVTRLRNRIGWQAPALVMLRFDPDTRSATAVRLKHPNWADAYVDVQALDGVTRRVIGGSGVLRKTKG
ncbi:nicotinate-nucleotide adenylyltransferase [Croceicoccus sp. F390]|uniref:Probable nicotinate-nucleotide adenylyltransferase n=1 Tax=Croceicoccus esteveae TaxID=3075597 RepID=A0ABU2ZHL7_9SPHN|nr:nicotinate-nucleotide adenylyltransferase [Croceicoccus sp. F390]MDT0576100.1 nicotinate-nucleotide adenylyltransferase [Croceicoccus sp. F390]